ncbi:MAG: hypothetical protein ACLQAT_14655 [Candidatus Binataceae bacterium]
MADASGKHKVEPMAGDDEDQNRASAWKLISRILTVVAYLIGIVVAFAIVLLVTCALLWLGMRYSDLFLRYLPH